VIIFVILFHLVNLISVLKAQALPAGMQDCWLLKMNPLSKSILIANAIPAVGIPNWVNKIV